MTLPVEQVGARTWAIETRHVGGKVGVVVGDERTLVIDAGADPVEGSAVAETATSLGHLPLSVVLTHGHWDHARGLGGMRRVELLVHEDAWPSAHMQLDVASRAPGSVDGAEPAVTTFDAPWTIDLGGVTVELVDAPGHAPGSVCVRVVEDGVLFGGDTLVTAIPPVFADGHSTILERTLRRLADIDVEVAVPGHGRAVRGLMEVRRALHRGADLLADTREQVGSLFGPHDADEVATFLALRDAGAFDPGLVPVADLTLRHERMVRALVGEVGLRPANASNASSA